MEGCAEHQINDSDAKINDLGKSIFVILKDEAARERFVEGQQAWLAYRHAECSGEADVNEGGSLAVVDFGVCEERINDQRTSELRRLLGELEVGYPDSGAR